MNLCFRNLGTNEEVVDILDYINKSIQERPGIQLYVGTDSQNNSRSTMYATVILLHFNENGNGKGGNVLYCKEQLPKIRDRYTRLWGEVERSIEVANILRNGGLNIKNIDLDFNEDSRWGSNSVLRAAVGYVEASGYVARWKPMNTHACRVADVLVHS